MRTRSEEELRRLIAGVKREIVRLGDMRPGRLSVQCRRSGGREIGYNQPSFTFAGRSRTEYVREGIDRVVNETREECRQRLSGECPAALRNVIREEGCPDEASIPALAKGYGA